MNVTMKLEANRKYLHKDMDKVHPKYIRNLLKMHFFLEKSALVQETFDTGSRQAYLEPILIETMHDASIYKRFPGWMGHKIEVIIKSTHKKSNIF